MLRLSNTTPSLSGAGTVPYAPGNNSCDVPVNDSHPILVAIFVNFGRVHGYLGLCVCIFGIISNLLNIVVLTRPNMRSSTNWLLVWLAVADLLTMVPYLPQLIHFFILQQVGDLYLHTDSYAWIRYLQFVASFVIICHSAAIWLTVALAVFRFLFISPQSSRFGACISHRSASFIIGLIFVMSLVVTLPNILINQIRVCHRNLSSREVVLYEVTRSGPVLLNSVNFWLQAIIVKIVPCILLTIMTVLLILQLRNASVRRKSLLGGKSGSAGATNGRRPSVVAREIQDTRTTTMLLAIVILFILTELPQGIMMLCMHQDITFFGRIYRNLGDLIDFVTLCNESINFLLYTSMSSDFRRTFSKIFCCCSCAKKDIDYTINNRTDILTHGQSQRLLHKRLSVLNGELLATMPTERRRHSQV